MKNLILSVALISCITAEAQKKVIISVSSGYNFPFEKTTQYSHGLKNIFNQDLVQNLREENGEPITEDVTASYAEGASWHINAAYHFTPYISAGTEFFFRNGKTIESESKSPTQPWTHKSKHTGFGWKTFVRFTVPVVKDRVSVSFSTGPALGFLNRIQTDIQTPNNLNYSDILKGNASLGLFFEPAVSVSVTDRLTLTGLVDCNLVSQWTPKKLKIREYNVTGSDILNDFLDTDEFSLTETVPNPSFANKNDIKKTFNLEGYSVRLSLQYKIDLSEKSSRYRE